MKMFIDTANVDQIREANDLGVICGVTTNPSLIAKEGRNFEDLAGLQQRPCWSEGRMTSMSWGSAAHHHRGRAD